MCFALCFMCIVLPSVADVFMPANFFSRGVLSEKLCPTHTGGMWGFFHPKTLNPKP